MILNNTLPSITTHSEGVALHETQSDGWKEEMYLEVFQNDQVLYQGGQNETFNSLNF